MGSPDFSSGDTNANMDPSPESAIWLTSPETEIANSMRVAGAGRLARNQATPAPITNASATTAQTSDGILRRASGIRAVPLASVPDKALSANDKSFAD